MQYEFGRLKSLGGYVLFFALLSLGTVAVVLAEAPPVPAGSENAVQQAAPAAVSGAAAPAPAPASPLGGGGGMVGFFLPLIGVFALLYFVSIRPQQKKMKEHQTMVNKLEKGDEVITQSGLIGKISGISEKVVTLELSQNVKVKMLKNQVATIAKGGFKDLT